MKFSLGIFFLLTTLAAQAGPLEDKTRKLFQVQGVVGNYQSLIDQSRAQAQEDTKQILNQMLSQLNPSKEFQVKIKQAADRYVKALLTDRTAEQIVEVLIKYYAPSFSEGELDKLIEFYGSALGRKDAAVSKAATEKLIKHYKSENEKIRISATDEFVKDLRSIAQQCNCPKPANPSTKK